uniref:Uncharacterized protein n=1 Tax=Triticum urartu TaxID=4572 RepID=A0A8R7TQ69_TRIUA
MDTRMLNYLPEQAQRWLHTGSALLRPLPSTGRTMRKMMPLASTSLINS